MSDPFLDLPYRPCVGIMLMNTHGLIFTGERIDTPGAWQMPQGGIDAGESPLQAAVREIGEEIGVQATDVEVMDETQGWLTYDLPEHLLGKMWGGRYRGQKQKWFKMALKAADSAINIETAHPEFARWKWATPSDVLTDIVDFKRSLYQEILAELLP